MKRRFLLFACLGLAGCEATIFGRVETCGEYPPGGGPAVISTRDQEICDVVRLRVGREMAKRDVISRAEIDRLLERTAEWAHKKTVDTLIAAIRREGGDAIADEVRRAIDAVFAHSSMPMPKDCPDTEACIVKGAVQGLVIALKYTQPKDPPQTPDEKQPAGN